MVMFLSGKDIATIRESLGMTLKEFGKLLGVAEATVSRWEADKRRPRYEMMERLNDLSHKGRRIATAAK